MLSTWSSLTAAFQMTGAEYMTATSEKKPCHEAILGVDAVRKPSNRLPVTLVHVCERGATYRAGVDEVEGSGAMLRWALRCVGAHGDVYLWVLQKKRSGAGNEVRCSAGIKVWARQKVWKARTTTPRRETLMVHRAEVTIVKSASLLMRQHGHAETY
jgi:hypothetical protein